MAISLQQARQQVLEHVSVLPKQQLALNEAGGRAVLDDLHAQHQLPSFANSAMDGFAFSFDDIKNSETLPVRGFIPAGSSTDIRLTQGTMAKIMTGAPIPQGANTVIPIENCDYDEHQVSIVKPVAQGANIRLAGEDVAYGQLLATAGTKLTSGMINLLAALQFTQVPVTRQLRVAILATGDELQEVGEPLLPGGVVNSNSQGLAAALKEINALPILLGIAQDNKDSLRERISDGLGADVLITSAGVSAGDRDLVREVLDEKGYQEVFWKVDLRPGKPTAFGICKGTPVFALPGNPVATMTLFELLARPALLKMMGHKDLYRPTYRARLIAPIKKKAAVNLVVRLSISYDEQGELCATSAGNQNTGALSTLAAANGYAILPAGKETFESGEQIEVNLL